LISLNEARSSRLIDVLQILRALKSHQHPNIVRFEDFVITPSYALVIMDYHSRLMPVEVAEAKAKVYFKALLSAVGYLHANGCSHNDIKPANILLSAEDTPKLCDFGFAQCYSLDTSDKPPFRSTLSWGSKRVASIETYVLSLRPVQLQRFVPLEYQLVLFLPVSMQYLAPERYVYHLEMLC